MRKVVDIALGRNGVEIICAAFHKYKEVLTFRKVQYGDGLAFRDAYAHGD